MSRAEPKISVIMAVYNSAPYLRRALNSVCNQTFRDLEIVCVNDGSTDESPAILAEYAARDARIRVIDHGEKRGVACARNSGFAAAAGEAVGIVDSDDVIGRNFFAELWKAYEAHGCDIAKGRLLKQNQDGRWKEHYINNDIKITPLTFFWQWQSAIYSTRFIRKYNLTFAHGVDYGEDALFLYKLMGHAPQISFTDDAIYYYLHNGSSLTHTQPDDFYLAAHVGIARRLKEYLPNYPRESQRKNVFRALINFLHRNLNKHYANCDWSSYLGEIKAILDDDQFYTPLKSFPFLRIALEAQNIQELKIALKGATGYLMAMSWRENLRKKSS